MKAELYFEANETTTDTRDLLDVTIDIAQDLEFDSEEFAESLINLSSQKLIRVYQQKNGVEIYCCSTDESYMLPEWRNEALKGFDSRDHH